DHAGGLDTTGAQVFAGRVTGEDEDGVHACLGAHRDVGGEPVTDHYAFAMRALPADAREGEVSEIGARLAKRAAQAHPRGGLDRRDDRGRIGFAAAPRVGAELVGVGGDEGRPLVEPQRIESDLELFVVKVRSKEARTKSISAGSELSLTPASRSASSRGGSPIGYTAASGWFSRSHIVVAVTEVI